MPLFEITKPINATLIIECASEKEAMNWADKIVADVQDENGNRIESKAIILFEADVKVSEIKIEELSKAEAEIFA
ncbi:MAG TPA: hypothetical protein PKE69_02485 [Pyrinomonadaceae bacterium]|nr:hypothetical protein [Pyrinomonadaceae bacterium]